MGVQDPAVMRPIGSFSLLETPNRGGDPQAADMTLMLVLIPIATAGPVMLALIIVAIAPSRTDAVVAVLRNSRAQRLGKADYPATSEPVKRVITAAVDTCDVPKDTRD
jgi:hypothetical protein